MQRQLQRHRLAATISLVLRISYVVCRKLIYTIRLVSANLSFDFPYVYLSHIRHSDRRATEWPEVEKSILNRSLDSATLHSP